MLSVALSLSLWVAPIADRHAGLLASDPAYRLVWGPAGQATYSGLDRDAVYRRVAVYARLCGVTAPGEYWSFDPDRPRPLNDPHFRGLRSLTTLRARVRGEPVRLGEFIETDYPRIRPGFGPGLPIPR